MRANNPFPPDPYGKPPPSLKSAALRRDWYKLTADVREAFWTEHLARDGSDTQPESDSDVISPSELLRELPKKKTGVALPEEETQETVSRTVPFKPTSVSGKQYILYHYFIKTHNHLS
jgi:hypothetical protein